MKAKHWQDPLNALLGIWLIVSPWVLGARWTSWAGGTNFWAGVILLISSVVAMSSPHAWEEWVDAIVGVLLFISPWVLGFSGAAAVNAWICGVVIVVLSLWVLGVDPQFGWGQRSAR